MSVFSEAMIAKTLPLAGGPTTISKRMLEHWRGEQDNDRSGQVAISASDTTVHADRHLLMAWCDKILLSKLSRHCPVLSRQTALQCKASDRTGQDLDFA